MPITLPTHRHTDTQHTAQRCSLFDLCCKPGRLDMVFAALSCMLFLQSTQVGVHEDQLLGFLVRSKLRRFALSLQIWDHVEKLRSDVEEDVPMLKTRSAMG